MELLKANYLQTSTSLVVNSNTVTASYVMNPDTSFQYVSSGLNDDTTYSSMRVNFTETMTVSRIALAGINLKEFRLYYDGATANTFALTSTGATTVSSWNANSETSMYLQCTPVYCTSVTLDMKKTTTANQEKAVGYFVVAQELLDFARIPSANNYLPILDSQQVKHRLSDGTTRIQSVADRWRAGVRLNFVTEAMRNTLRTIYQLHQGMIFVPFGTTTGWDGVIFPCVWEAPFSFYQFSDNSPGAGFEGAISLMETSP